MFVLDFLNPDVCITPSCQLCVFIDNGRSRKETVRSPWTRTDRRGKDRLNLTNPLPHRVISLYKSDSGPWRSEVSKGPLFLFALCVCLLSVLLFSLSFGGEVEPIVPPIRPGHVVCSFDKNKPTVPLRTKPPDFGICCGSPAWILFEHEPSRLWHLPRQPRPNLASAAQGLPCMITPQFGLSPFAARFLNKALRALITHTLLACVAHIPRTHTLHSLHAGATKSSTPHLALAARWSHFHRPAPAHSVQMVDLELNRKLKHTSSTPTPCTRCTLEPQICNWFAVGQWIHFWG